MLILFFFIFSLLLLFFVYKFNWLVVIFYLSISCFFCIFFLYRPITSFCHISYNSYLDYLSSSLILLTLWIRSIIFMCSYKVELRGSSSNIFFYSVYILILVLLITFMTNNFFLFYILFEISLIPTIILIMGWGYQPERLQASVYIIIYTVCASLPLLVGLVYQGFIRGSFLIFFSINLYLTNLSFINLWWLCFIFAFIVKMPLYLTHLWLPKAHLEAPVAGSMILAGILLKLGGYGLLRVSGLVFWANNYFCGLFISISIWGAVITSLICIYQFDMKSLIAYSSVGHIGLLIRGFISGQIWGWSRSLSIMIAHGIVSSGLFSLANMSYENTSSRSIYLTKGLLSVLPSISLFWFILRAFNIGAPLSINLISEIILIGSILSSSFYICVLVGFSGLFTGVYALYFYTSTQHGQFSSYISMFLNINFRIFRSLLFHILPVLLLIVCVDFISLWL